MPAMPAPVHRAACLAGFLAACLAGNPARAFGPTGHRLAGTIAQHHLCAPAAAGLAPLLGGWSLATAGLWADMIRGDPAWERARAWHYLDVEDNGSLALAARRSGDNALAALVRFEARLADEQLPLAARQEALRFVVHLVADLHQPLHVGRPGDRGGNLVLVRWPDARGPLPVTLHAVWDGEVLLAGEAGAPWVAAAYPLYAWTRDPPETWAGESRALRSLVYALPPGPVPTLEPGYVDQARQLLRLRLVQAGLRLAARLNAAMGCPRVEPAAASP